MIHGRYSIAFYIVTFIISPLFITGEAYSHGSMETPVSRVYNCFLENPENPKSEACRAAVQEGGTQALYDWNGVNQGSANDRHREIIPDGKLCSGGNELFKGLDLARGDWPSTMIAPDENGKLDFVFRATAPHSTEYFRFYVTRDDYDPLLPLKWSDLGSSPFCEITTVTLDNGRYKMTCPFPAGKSGKHVIYAIWQRDDSPEAFYTCMDVEFGGGVPSVWRSLGTLRAQQDLSSGDTVTLRLFDSSGGDAETHSITLSEAQTGADDWPFHLAEEVNSSSSLLRVGVLDSEGNIEPVRESQGNTVYVSSDSGFSFELDIKMQDNGGGDGGGGDTCECCDMCTDPDPEPGGDFDFAYPEGIGSYGPGNVVLGTDGSLYECRPFPNSGWCNQSELYYAPGTGLAWADAWFKIN